MMKKSESSFSHIGDKGTANMVDISDKEITHRKAVARAVVQLTEGVTKEFEKDDIHTRKGSVFQTATIAGIMGAKQTSAFIPLCHNIDISNCDIDIKLTENHEAVILCTVTTDAKTGVEMEALTGANIAALTIYDMCKSFTHEIIIKDIELIEKSGGRSDYKKHE